jgi:hypothetical protein
VFDIDQVLVCEDLRLAERRSLRPFGLFTMLRFVKEPGFELVPQRMLGAKSEVRVPARVPARSRLPEPIRVRIKWISISPVSKPIGGVISALFPGQVAE